jgi:hypothetical protein
MTFKPDEILARDNSKYGLLPKLRDIISLSLNLHVQSLSFLGIHLRIAQLHSHSIANKAGNHIAATDPKFNGWEYPS